MSWRSRLPSRGQGGRRQPHRCRFGCWCSASASSNSGSACSDPSWYNAITPEVQPRQRDDCDRLMLRGEIIASPKQRSRVGKLTLVDALQFPSRNRAAAVPAASANRWLRVRLCVKEIRRPLAPRRWYSRPSTSSALARVRSVADAVCQRPLQPGAPLGYGGCAETKTPKRRWPGGPRPRHRHAGRTRRAPRAGSEVALQAIKPPLLAWVRPTSTTRPPPRAPGTTRHARAGSALPHRSPPAAPARTPGPSPASGSAGSLSPTCS